MNKIRASRAKVLQVTSIIASVGIVIAYFLFGLLPYTLPVFLVLVVLVHTVVVPAVVDFTDEK